MSGNQWRPGGKKSRMIGNKPPKIGSCSNRSINRAWVAQNPIDFGKISGNDGAAMGGMGSGNWYRWRGKKATVEESLTVAMRDFRSKIYPHASGAFSWNWTGGNRCSIGYFVTWGAPPTITLQYRWLDSEDVRIPVHLQTTPTRFGGERWWFTCPLIVGGEACNRRAGKLHLPPGAKYFGCRKCHDLTYRSCQEAHREERLFASISRIEDWLDTLKSRQR